VTKATEEARRPRLRRQRLAGAIAVLVVALVVSLTLLKHVVPLRAAVPVRKTFHGPWIYGNPAARFTIIEYADLECPYCRAYFPVLRHWIDEHREVNWQWRNLPLAMHEPAALHEALLAECAGEVGGNRTFWRAVAWIYAHTRGEGAGLPVGAKMPGMSGAISRCLGSAPARKVIHAQVAAAARDHVLGTPTLKLIDLKTRRSLELAGPTAGDVLLSAIGALASLPARPVARLEFEPPGKCPAWWR
jgi:protein-disulfide isomerase